MTMRTALTLSAILAALGCDSGGPGTAAPASGPSGLISRESRKAAPDFALKDLDGKEVKLSSFRGKAVLLNFWAVG